MHHENEDLIEKDWKHGKEGRTRVVEFTSRVCCGLSPRDLFELE